MGGGWSNLHFKFEIYKYVETELIYEWILLTRNARLNSRPWFHNHLGGFIFQARKAQEYSNWPWSKVAWLTWTFHWIQNSLLSLILQLQCPWTQSMTYCRLPSVPLGIILPLPSTALSANSWHCVLGTRIPLLLPTWFLSQSPSLSGIGCWVQFTRDSSKKILGKWKDWAGGMT